MGSALVVVSPVRDEATHIEVVARAMAAQTRPPDLWIVVDDDSSDETPQMLHAFQREIPFMRVVSRGPEARAARSGKDRLARGECMRAFKWGLSQVRIERFGYIAKIDGDIELPPHYFEHLLERFERDPSLGIACGDIVEPARHRWKRLAIPSHHVHGALKLYRRECLQAIPELVEGLGWDTIDETYARMRGFTTRSFRDLVVRHHRPAGSRDGALRGHARHARCAYLAHYPLAWVMLRSIKVARRRPTVLSGLAFFYGYVREATRGTPRVADEEFRAFVRRELRGRMLRGLRPRPSRRARSSHSLGATEASADVGFPKPPLTPRKGS
jgi:hypothetical protein